MIAKIINIEATDRQTDRLADAEQSMTDPNQRLLAIIDGCVEHDRRAQEKVYELFYGKMMAVCLRYTKNADQAKDILQDGFIKVFNSIEGFNKAGSFEGWIRRIMVNTAIDHFRKTKNSYLLLGVDRSIEDFGDPDAEDTIAESIEEDEGFKAADVVNALQKLTPAYRTVFNLYVFEDLTHKEIAEKLGISVGTSKSNYAKAKNNLRTLLNQGRMNLREPRT
jgi:RNA polymerase sigma-70 factor (ECF subfamily)